MERNKLLEGVQLSDMQQEAIAAWQTHNDVMVLSPTGSGKTLAYLGALTMFPEQITLVIVPGRELAVQVVDVAQRGGINAMALYGGRAAMDEHRRLKTNRPQLIVATPGRINDHLKKGNVDATAISTLIIDEFDKCLELGFQDEMREVIGMLTHVERRCLTSATELEGRLPDFINGRYHRVDYLNQGAMSQRRTYAVRSDEKDKLECLRCLLSHIGNEQTLVFVAHRESADRVVDFLRGKGMTVAKYHGGMEQEDRERGLFMFVSGCASVMVSTDLAARGLDIPDMQHVVHYHLPLKEDEYIHRQGRAGRWDRTGTAWLIVGPTEELPVFVEAQWYGLPATTEVRIPRPRFSAIYIGRGKKDKISRGDVLGFLCKAGRLSADEVGRITLMDHHCFVSVARSKAHDLVASLKGQKIKGQKTVFEISK